MRLGYPSESDYHELRAIIASVNERGKSIKFFILTAWVHPVGGV
jgi:hypothetical protein